MQKLLIFCFIFCGLLACSQQQQQPTSTPPSPTPIASFEKHDTLIQKIAFGSCAHQDEPQPILSLVVAQQPDLFIYLGDNIYGDTEDMKILQQKYDQLEAKPEFQNLRENMPILAIWDDHDYGENDAGKEYPFKAASKEIFLDFWQVAPNSPRRKHEGIYHAHLFEKDGKKLQIILLDTRTFRDSLSKNYTSIRCKNDYCPDENSSASFLGETQWNWLKQELQRPADIRLIASSIQFSHEYNGWESWTNLPKERERFIKLIAETKANGVFFISGDVHWGELSKQSTDAYPIYDVTSSGLTQTWDKPEPNANRMGEIVMENNFGLLEINWELEQPSILMKIIDIDGTTRVSHQVSLEEISH